MNSHALDLRCALIACEEDGLETGPGSITVAMAGEIARRIQAGFFVSLETSGSGNFRSNSLTALTSAAVSGFAIT